MAGTCVTCSKNRCDPLLWQYIWRNSVSGDKMLSERLQVRWRRWGWCWLGGLGVVEGGRGWSDYPCVALLVLRSSSHLILQIKTMMTKLGRNPTNQLEWFTILLKVSFSSSNSFQLILGSISVSCSPILDKFPNTSETVSISFKAPFMINVLFFECWACAKCCTRCFVVII